MLAVALALCAGTARGLLKEPDKIIYGSITVSNHVITAADTQYVVEVHSATNGALLGSCRMGDDTNLYERAYLTRFTLEAYSPNEDAELLVGDLLDLVLKNGAGTVMQIAYTVTNRGSSRVDFGPPIDTDGDTLPDLDEMNEYGSNPERVDSDGDRYSDPDEVAAGSDPADSADRPSYKLVVTSAQGTPAVAKDMASQYTNVAHTVKTGFAGARALCAADMEGDGDVDVVGGASTANTVAWWESDGTGTNWTEHLVDAAFTGARAVSVADLDGDGDLDVLGAAHTTNDPVDLAWWENDGTGTNWVRHVLATNFNLATGIKAGDIDGDGDMDVAASSFGISMFAWWENDGTATNWIPHSIDSLSGASALELVDLDGNGTLDLLGSAQTANTIKWWSNDDGGTNWTAHSVATGLVGAESVTTGDMDGDGDLDVLGAAYTEDVAGWWENTDGAGTAWSEHRCTNVFDGARSVAAADINGDHRQDIVGTASYGDDVAWWDNADGTGTNLTTQVTETSFDGATIAFGIDINDDLAVDILGAAEYANAIMWWEVYPAGYALSAYYSVAASVSTTKVLRNTSASCAISSPVTAGTTQYLCQGWTGTGSAPSSGLTTNTGTFVMTEDSSVTWLWATNVYFSRTAGANGQVTGATNGWYALGAGVVVTAVPAPGYTLAGWSGDVPAGQTNDNPLALTLGAARSVTATFVPDPAGSVYWMKVAFNGYSKGETLTNFPAAVALHEGLTNFLYSQCASPSGYDLRFFDANGTDLLNHEIETWNTGGTSYVWVQVPQLSASTDYVWACWGLAGITSAPAYTTNGATWTEGYRAVWHLKEDAAGAVSNGLYKDSTVYAHHGDDRISATGKVGVINGGQDFDGTDDRIGIAHKTSLKPSAQISVSAWVRPRNITTNPYYEIYRKEDGTSRHLFSFQGSGTILAFGLNIGSYAEVEAMIDPTDYTDGNWHLIYGTYDGEQVRLYRDGVEIQRTPASGSIATGGTAAAYIGSASGSAEFFNGLMDEVRLSAVGRSSNWIWACWMNGISNETFVSYDAAVRKCALEIVSDHGTADPAVGVHVTDAGSVLTNAVASPDVQGSTQYVCTGWSMTGHDPDGGTTNTFVMTVTNDAVLTWNWTTNVQWGAEVDGHGTLTGDGSGWYPLGGSVTVTAVPDANYLFAGWAGDLDAGDTNDNPLTLPMDQPRSVTARFVPESANALCRMKVQFTGYSRTEPLSNFPALVTLHEGLQGFRYGDFAAADGADLRFEDAAGALLLNHEVEEWDTNGNSYVWVQIPQLAGNNDYVWACWGNTNATTPPACTTNGAVWSEGYSAVWHMTETNASDSTTNRINGTAHGNTTASGQIAMGGRFNGTTSYIDLANPAALPAGLSARTISCWGRALKTTAGYRWLMAYGTNAVGKAMFVGLNGTTLVGGGYSDDVSCANIWDTNQWHHVALTYDGSNAVIYADGSRVASLNKTWNLVRGRAYIGRQVNNAEYWDGLIDEVRVCNVARSSNWVWACWMNQRTGSTFVAYGAVLGPENMDRDGDGMPDWWEDKHFGGPTNANVSSHSDADIYSDWEEWLADTDPHSVTSYLCIAEIDVATRAITFVSSTGRIYTLQYSEFMAGSGFVWSNLVDGAWGTNVLMTITDTNGASYRCYRLKVRLPPE